MGRDAGNGVTALDSIKLIFAFTLVLLIGFSVSFSQTLGWPDALPWVAAAWIGWVGGVAWVRSRHW
ncbi:MAG: hypothetical protein IT306_25505 [Chloroflexi bacterium]|nr:hypothetical protein [Chloroflexota bacterium]